MSRYNGKRGRLQFFIVVLFILVCLTITLAICDKISCRSGCPDGAHCRKINFFTSEECFYSADGEKIAKNSIENLQRGDILVTMSIHTLGLRHGHCAIVVNTKPFVVVEATSTGHITVKRKNRNWLSYADFSALRIKNDVAEKCIKSLEIMDLHGNSVQGAVGDLAANIAISECLEKKYSIFAGVNRKNLKSNELAGTQCAHLIWYIYYSLGIDLGEKAGNFITPQDIKNSQYLESVS